MNLLTVFDDFVPELEIGEPPIDCDFIIDFLLPYFTDMQRDALAAKVEEVIAFEKGRDLAGLWGQPGGRN